MFIVSLFTHMMGVVLSTLRNQKSRKKTFAVIVFICLLIVRKFYDVLIRKFCNYPPGPAGLPVLGSMPFLNSHRYLNSLRRAYGSVFMINVGANRYVFLSDLDVVRKEFAKKVFSKRNIKIVDAYDNIWDIDGAQYALRRQLMLRSFVGKLNSQFLAGHCYELLQKDLFTVLDAHAMSHQPRPFLVNAHIKYSVSGLMHFAIFGRFVAHPDKNDEQNKMLLQMLRVKTNNAIFAMASQVILGSTRLSKWLINNVSFAGRRFVESERRQHELLEEWLTEFEKNYQQTELDVDDGQYNHEAALVAWYKQYQKGLLSRCDVLCDISAMFAAGIDTSSLFLTKIILSLADQPHVQHIMYCELKACADRHAADGPAFVLRYIYELHIFRACIEEVLRSSTDSPAISMIPRPVLDDGVQIEGYNIPKFAQVVSMNLFIRQQTKYFENAHRFDHTHFLDENGKFKTNEAMSIFGYGRRSCPGASLARRIAYLLTAQLLLRYTFHPTKNNDPHWLRMTNSSVFVRKRNNSDL